MRSIKVIVDHMHETLEEAQVYYRDYVEYNIDCPRLANVALEMAKTHLDLYSKWHNVVIQLIMDYKSNKGEAPKEMQAIWNYEHERLVEEYNELKYKVSLI